jgi:hypothetical protein
VTEPRRRVEPRLVLALALVAVPVLWLIGQILLTQATAECGEADHGQVGGLVQLFVPGDACTEPPAEEQPTAP